MPLFFFLCVAECFFFCVTQVDAFLEANDTDTGVTDADREVAKGQ